MRHTVLVASIGAVLAVSACKPVETEAPVATAEAEAPAEEAKPVLVEGPTTAQTDYVGPGALRMKLGLKRGDYAHLFSQTAGVKLMPTIKVENGWAYGPAQVGGQDVVALWKEDGSDWKVLALTHGETKGDFKKFCGQAPAGLIPDCA